MLDYPDDIALILFKRITGTEISSAETALLEKWLQKDDSNKELYNFLMNDELLRNDFYNYYLLKHPRVVYVGTDLGSKVVSFRKIYKKWAIVAMAASLILIIGSYIIFSAAERNTRNKQAGNFPMNNTSQAAMEVVLPAVQRAALTLNNERKIDLAQNSALEIAKDGSVLIDGLAESHSLNKESTPGSYTLTTPRGGYYQMTLNDGTKVWLNAASSLKFPKVFDGISRRIQLSGEAFFSVSKIAAQPFIVETDNGNVEVLGTSFNLKIYKNEPMTTSLISGSVKISSGPENRNSKIIAPGQQAVVRSSDAIIQIGEFKNDPIAWRQNSFSFSNVSLLEVLQEISRWYDVDVKVKVDTADKVVLNGGFDRRLPLDRLLPHLSDMSGLQLTLKDKTIMVTNK